MSTTANAISSSINANFSKLTAHINATFEKAGCTVFSHYVSGKDLTYVTKGLSERQWPELMMNMSSQLLAQSAMAIVLDDWLVNGPDFTTREYKVGNKSTSRFEFHVTEYLGVPSVRVTLIPKKAKAVA